MTSTVRVFQVATGNVGSEMIKRIANRDDLELIGLHCYTADKIGRDAGGSTYTLLASAALAATAFTEMLVYPSASNVVNLVSNQPLPPSWGVNYSAASGTIAATISYAYAN